MAEAPPRMRPTTPTTAGGDGPTIRRRRSLPGGRAVVGAFLVVAAAVGTFGAYLSAAAAPSTSYLLATRSLELGEVLTEADLVGADAAVRSEALDLPPALATRAYATDPAAVARLVGQVVVAPVEPGDLLLASQFADVAAAEGGVVLSFSIAADRALAGRVEVGEQVDLVATYPASGPQGSETRVVARRVTVVGTSGVADGLNGGRVTLTVEVADLGVAQDVQHAVDVAQVAVLRGGDPAAALPPATSSDEGPADD